MKKFLGLTGMALALQGCVGFSDGRPQLYHSTHAGIFAPPVIAGIPLWTYPDPAYKGGPRVFFDPANIQSLCAYGCPR